MQTVLLTLLNGRHFAKSATCKVYIQCKFNDEYLATDPCHLSATPAFSTELAWEMTSKSLSYLRSQRASMKLECFVLDSSMQRTYLGYIMLDLRSAALITHPGTSLPAKWFPLVNTKQQNLGVYRSEILIALCIGPKEALEKVHVRGPQKPMNEQQKPSRKENQSKIEEMKVDKKIEPSKSDSVPACVLLPTGIYQIGPNSEDADLYTLSMTISFTSNLEDILPTPHPSLLFLEIGFMNGTILTETFGKKKEFVAEKISVHFQGTRDDIFQFVTGKKFDISLLAVDTQRSTKIGQITINCQDIIKSYPSILESVYPFQAGLNAGLGISCSIAKDGEERSFIMSPRRTPRLREPEDRLLSPDEKENILKDLAIEGRKKFKSPLPSPAVPPLSPLLPTVQAQYEYHDLKETSWHQFRLSIDIQRVLNISVRPDTPVLVKYTWNAFSREPFYTDTVQLGVHPYSKVVTKEQVLNDGQRFERGYVSFEFVMSRQMLETYLGGIPVYVSLFQKDKYQKNVLMGEAVFMLDEIVKGT